MFLQAQLTADWGNGQAAMSMAGCDKFKFDSVRARVGVSRAMMNGNVPREYVTPADLRAGLRPRYKVLYLPASLSMSRELQGMSISTGTVKPENKYAIADCPFQDSSLILKKFGVGERQPLGTCS